MIFKIMQKKKYQIGLVIGRFQPLHKGHAFLIKKALTFAECLIIGIGSTNVKNSDNPLSFFQRKQLVQLYVRSEGLKDKVKKIISLPDVPNDNEWLKDTLKKTGKIDVVIGNNDWVNGIFEEAGVPIVEIPYYKRYLMEGVKIRKLMKDGKSWENRVPSSTLKVLKNFLQSTQTS